MTDNVYFYIALGSILALGVAVVYAVRMFRESIREYKRGYDEGKKYARAQMERLCPIIKVETRQVEHLKATMLVSAEDQMFIPAEAMAESIGRGLKNRLLEALAPYWTIRHEYRPEVHAYEYTMHLDVLRKDREG